MQIYRNLLKNQNCVTCILSFASKYSFPLGIETILLFGYMYTIYTESR